MAKLTKQQSKRHLEACALLEKDKLTFDEKWFVLEHWHEGAEHINSRSGAFFTPPALASDFAIDAAGSNVIDLCAGIGTLAFAYYHRFIDYRDDTRKPQITCAELNPAYVAVGKKILPEANWICADVFDVWLELGRFDGAISNPPFGKNGSPEKSPLYKGSLFEYKIIDIASHLADYGTFILPQNSAGFSYSGVQCYQRRETAAYRKFADETGLYLEAGCGVDTSYHADEWKNVKPSCEIVTCDFTEREEAKDSISAAPAAQLALFEEESAAAGIQS